MRKTGIAWSTRHPASQARRSIGGAQAADRVARTTSDLADQVSTSLKSYGVDTDQMKAIARDQAGQLQQALVDTVRSRPIAALAVAAALGVVLGVMTTR